MCKQTIKAVRMTITDTRMLVNGSAVPVQNGVVQGSILRPTLLSLYMNKLLDSLGGLSGTSPIANADDILLICEKRTSLDTAIKVLEEWCLLNSIKINYEKSAVLISRADKRTPASTEDQIGNFPIRT